MWKGVRLSVLAWLNVVLVDVRLRRGGFGALRAAVLSAGAARGSGAYTHDEISESVMGALRWYRPCSPCLVQSIAIALLVRTESQGRADVVLGVHRQPIRSEPPYRPTVSREFCGHAWVEANGDVLVDDPDFVGQYDVVDRF